MISTLRQTYAGKKVFLTGHTGFKGAWMLAVLNYLGAETMGYALEPEGDKNLYSLIHGDALCRSIIGDIRDKKKLTDTITAFRPDFIFHLAAQSLVIRSYEKPGETYEVNVIGTVNVLEALQNIEGKCSAVMITTDKVYENREWIFPYRENDSLGGFDPYSSSKACAEIAVASFRRSFFHPEKISDHKKGLATARAGNVIGGGDWAENRIIPDLMRSIETDSILEVRNPQSVRPWQHVLEPVTAYLLLGSRVSEDPRQFSDAFNFGPYSEDSLTVREVVEKAIAVFGSGRFEEKPNASAVHEAKMLRLDISKAVNVLSWKPKWDAKMALIQTMNWYKTYNVDPLKVTLDQVESYFGTDAV